MLIHSGRPNRRAGAARLAPRTDDPAAMLEDRARRLAQTSAEPTSGSLSEMLVFRLRDELCAVEPPRLRSVQWARDVTRLPCAPAYVAGLLNVRGDIVTVLDLGVAIGLAAAAAPVAGAPVLLADAPQGQVGLLVDEVIGVQRLALDDLTPPLSAGAFVRGVAQARIVVLDLERLLGEGRFEVSEDVV